MKQNNLNNCKEKYIEYTNYLWVNSNIFENWKRANEIEFDLSNPQGVTLQTEADIEFMNVRIIWENSRMLINNLIGRERMLEKCQKKITISILERWDEDQIVVKHIRKIVPLNIELIFQPKYDTFEFSVFQNFMSENCGLYLNNTNNVPILVIK